MRHRKAPSEKTTFHLSHLEFLEPRTLLASVSGVVFNDKDSDGIREAGEGGLANHTVYVDIDRSQSLTTSDLSATTDSAGAYTINNIPAGTFAVRYSTRSPYKATRSDTYITFAAADIKTGIDFGATAASGSVYVTVFLDNNGNGVRDAGEGGAYDVDVWLDLDNDDYIDFNEPQGTTNATGNVFLNWSPPGTYPVRFYSPSNYMQSFPADHAPLMVTVGTSNVNAGSFGTAPDSYFARIFGFVFQDDNINGRDDVAENSLLRDQVVYIDKNNNGLLDAGERTFVTQLDGYWFDALRPGTYVIRYAPSDGWAQTWPAKNGAQTLTVAAGERVNADFGTVNHPIDPPTVQSAQYLWDYRPPMIQFVFSEPPDPKTFDKSDLWLSNESGQRFDVTMYYNPDTRTALFSPSAGILHDGIYSARLPAGSFTNIPGMASDDYTFRFVILAGDLNHNGTVSIADFVTLSSNFGKTTTRYSDGDVNFDGRVTIADFIDLSANFGKTVTLEASPAAAESETVLAAPAPVPAAIETLPPISQRNKHHRKPHHFSRR